MHILKIGSKNHPHFLKELQKNPCFQPEKKLQAIIEIGMLLTNNDKISYSLN